LYKTRRSGKKINFTKRVIEALPAPPVGKRENVFDLNTPGLGLLIYPSGAKSFFHLKLVRGYPKRTTLGKFPDLTVDQARGKASGLNGALARWKLSGFSGEDPFEAQRDPTLGGLAAAYVEKHVRAHAARPEHAAQNVEWQVGKYFPSWRNRKIGSIRKADVLDLHERIGREHGKYQANRVVQLLRAIFYFGESSGAWQGVNPAAGVKLFHEEKRRRFLQPDELPRLFAALRKEPNADLRDFVNLAMWTGARRGDLLGARWENLYLNDNRWEIPNPKNRTPYNVALVPEAIEILRARKKRAKGKDNPFVFPASRRGSTGHIVNVKSAWKKLLTRSKLTELRMHDLRRTLGSWQAAGGASLQIIGESLGHKSLAATAVYSQLKLDPVRESVMTATRAMIAASKIKIPKQIKEPRS
jgi:integrase